jgi:RHS repeat-associated protein
MRGVRWAISGFGLTLLALSISVSPAHAQAKKNKPPKVHLSAPEHRYVAPGSIVLTAEVTDRDDPIAKVEFFNGDTLLATTTVAPYTFNWSNVAVGNYEVRAKATDARGATGTSNTFRVRVRDNVAPHVRILVPDNNATFAAPASILISLRANDRDDNLSSVELLANGTQLTAFTAAPYEFNWTNVLPGTYALTARATDELGLTTTSRTVTVQVTGAQPNVPPTVSLTSPTNNASFTAPAAIPLAAAAADSDGTISKVEFFYGSTLIATSTEAPYSVVWTGVPEGTYALTALVTDNLGASIGSSIVNITVARAEPKLYFIEVDHLNTPRRVSDAANTTVWRWDQQEPFGSNLPDENPTGLGAFDFPARLPGQYFDKETNLHYNSFRDYDPVLGRYVESDPLGLEAGLDTYGYVHGSPLRYFDIDGLRTQICCRLLNDVTRLAGPILRQRHCYVAIDSDRYGLYPIAGLGFVGWNDARDAGGICKDCKPKGCDNPDDCARQAAATYGVGRYGTLGPNSNTFAGTVARKCCAGGVPGGLGSAPGIGDDAATPLPPLTPGTRG